MTMVADDPRTACYRISPAVRLLEERLVECRRDLHRHPEPGFREVRTSGIVARRLEELGYRVRSGIAQTGVMGECGAGGGGRTLLIRFDMDALPIHEATGASYASTIPGWMHACGHDGHTSIGLALAELLVREPIPGTVKLIFQPAEEGPGGAKPMIEAGVMESPEVDHCLGLHLWTQLPVGMVGVRTGPTMADIATFDIQIHGRGGHGGSPHQTVDTLVIGAHLVTLLQTIVSRNTNPLLPAVLSIGEFHAGSAYNVIAEDAVLRGTIRSMDETCRETLITRMKEICHATGKAFGASVEMNMKYGYPAVVNDPAVAELVRQAALGVVGAERVTEETLWMAGEDMAYFLREKPGCFFFVGAANEARDLAYAHHNPRFDFDETAMLIAIEVLLQSVRRYYSLTSPD